MIESFIWPDGKKLQVSVFRLDLNHPRISGNKYYKLKPWIEKALQQQAGLMSCGGAWSNHLHALAAAGQEQGIASYGLVRGLEAENLTITLEDCRQMGMQLLAVSRKHYADRYRTDFAARYQAILPLPVLWVPEGGTDETAVVACESIGSLLNQQYSNNRFDSVWLAVGSGGTLAGIARSLRSDVKLFAVPVMKHWQSVRDKVNNYLTAAQASRINWIGEADYGGFGRYNHQHLAFLARLEMYAGIHFDPVYTGKLLRRLVELHQFAGLNVNKPLVIHTGGLQGRRSVANELEKIKRELKQVVQR
jgi:1-aminocyclopropane-1-carboxylate deaminase